MKLLFRRGTGRGEIPPRGSDPRRRRGWARMNVWGALTVLLVLGGAVAAVLGAHAVASSEAEKARLAFHLSSAEAASALKLAIQHEEDLIIDTSAFIKGDPTASPAAFDHWMEATRAMKRYPELENIGLVALVPAARLPAFETHLAANPVLPFGPHSAGASGPLQILPSGNRPYYCLAVAGIARSAADYLPAGVDYCKLSPQLIADRATALASYAPVTIGDTTLLGIETPIFRGRATPLTAAARRQAFVGWLGELLAPTVVLKSALQGHPGLVITLRYDSRFSHVAFSSGKAPKNSQSTTIDLLVGRAATLGNSHEGWAVQTFAAAVGGGVLDEPHALMLLIGGLLLSVLFGLFVLVLATGRRRAWSLVRDTTSELSEKNRELSHLALHDPLTGLPNRALVLDRAERLLLRAAREPGTLTGALFIDIDDFKRINDSIGHAAGDQFLKIVAERLLHTVRAQDTVGRLSGDEFVVLSELVAGESTLDRLADRLTEVLRQPVQLADGRQISTATVSIGVAVGSYATPDSLLRDADLALYAAKAEGKNRYTLFETSMSTSVEGRRVLESEMSTAVDSEQFFLLYQPIFDLDSRDIVGVEALVRWRHPQLGVVPPDDFIALAEESGLIVPIGRWVLDHACHQAAKWSAAGLRIGVSVNVSAYQLGRSDFVEDIRRVLAESGIEPSSLTLELTETALMRDTQTASDYLRQIKALGVRIAVDDFGTGYASLANLQRLPVDILKIDRSFVAALNGEGWSTERLHASELLEAILGVARALSLSVVAEGIEEQRQMTVLKAMGCEMGQGFLMAKPSPPDVISSLGDAGATPRAT